MADKFENSILSKSSFNILWVCHLCSDVFKHCNGYHHISTTRCIGHSDSDHEYERTNIVFPSQWTINFVVLRIWLYVQLEECDSDFGYQHILSYLSVVNWVREFARPAIVMFWYQQILNSLPVRAPGASMS